jgi:biopolymer transport protein TolR
MAFSMNTSNRAPMSEINVTPLVDVMLVLLIIFMVTAPMMQEGVSVDLPQAQGSPLDKKEENQKIIITVAAQGKILVNDVEVPEGELPDKIMQATKDKPSTEVYLRGDKSVPFGSVVRIMGTLTKAGVPNLGIITAPQEESVPSR